MGYVSEMRKLIGHKRLIMAGASVFIVKDDKVLLQKRRDNGCWSNHGGSIEIGESFEEAAKRELYEETGLISNNLRFLGVFSGKDMLYTYPNDDEVCNVEVAFICDDFSGDILEQTDETLELKWFSADKIPENISPPSKQAFMSLAQYMKNV